MPERKLLTAKYYGEDDHRERKWFLLHIFIDIKTRRRGGERVRKFMFESGVQILDPDPDPNSECVSGSRFTKRL